MRENGKKAVRFLHDEKGSSIVSVMAAFIILLIGLSMVTTATLSAMRTTANSAKIRRQTEECMEAFYLGSGADTDKKEFPTTFTLEMESGSSAQIPGQLTVFECTPEGQEDPFVLYVFENVTK